MVQCDVYHDPAELPPHLASGDWIIQPPSDNGGTAGELELPWVKQLETKREWLPGEKPGWCRSRGVEAVGLGNRPLPE